MSGEAGAAVTLVHLYRVETALTRLLEDLVRTHVQDTEVHHVSIDLLRWSRDHLHSIEQIAATRQIALNVPATTGPATSSALSAAQPSGPLELLDDLIRLACAATEASCAWVVAAQVAAARRDEEVQTLAQECHPRSRRQLRWAEATVQTLAAQALSSL